MKKSKAKKLWNLLFPLKIGQKVKVARIWHRIRLNENPQIENFVGKEGVVTSISIGWMDKKGWWTKKTTGRVECLVYDVDFFEGSSWFFMREDLEKMD